MNILYNISTLTEYLKSYHLLTGATMSIFDENFKEIISYPEKSSFCNKLRDNDYFNALCKNSDKENCLYSKEHMKLHIYKCHMGLTEAVYPIITDGVTLGYFMVGQFIQESEKDDMHRVLDASLEKYGFALNDFQDNFKDIPIVDLNKVIAATKLIQHSAVYLYYEKLQAHNNPIAEQIKLFVKKNLSEDLSSNTICKEFSLSKSFLYKIIKENFNCTVAEFIRNLKIHVAKEYLRDTKLPIYEISEMIGIPDYNYFTKVFKNIVGLTPREYRKQN